MMKKIVFDKDLDPNTSISSIAHKMTAKVMRSREYSSAEAAMLLMGLPMYHCTKTVKNVGNITSRSMKRTSKKKGTVSETKVSSNTVNNDEPEVHANSFDKYMLEVNTVQQTCEEAAEDNEVTEMLHKNYNEYLLGLEPGEKGLGDYVPNYRFKKRCSWPVTEDYAKFCLIVYKRGLTKHDDIMGSSTTNKQEFLKLLNSRLMPPWVENNLRRAWKTNMNATLVKEHRQKLKEERKNKESKKTIKSKLEGGPFNNCCFDVLCESNF